MIVNGSCSQKYNLVNNGSHALAATYKRFSDYSYRYNSRSYSREVINRGKLKTLTAVDRHFQFSANLKFEVHDDVQNETFTNKRLFELSGLTLDNRTAIKMQLFANNTGTTVVCKDGITVWCYETKSEGSCGKNGLPENNTSISVVTANLFFHYINTRKFSLKGRTGRGVMFPCQSVGKYEIVTDILASSLIIIVAVITCFLKCTFEITLIIVVIMM